MSFLFPNVCSYLTHIIIKPICMNLFYNRLLALRFFVLLIFAILCSKPCQAYEEDTHFLMTYVMLKSVGFTHGEALLVASVNEGMDDSPGVVATEGLTINVPEESLWHALDRWWKTPISPSRPDSIFARSMQIFNTAQAQADYRNKLLYLGVFFHFQQDIWAHRYHLDDLHLIPHGYTTYKTPQGHASAYKQPDRPPFDPVCALMCLEEGTEYAIRFLRESLHREPYVLFNGFQSHGGNIDTSWGQRSKYVNQILVEHVNNHEIKEAPSFYLQQLISAQINAYTFSYDAYYVGRTADMAKFDRVRSALQGICNLNSGLVGKITIPTLLEKQLQGFNTLTTPMLQNPMQAGIAVLENVAYTKPVTKSFDNDPALGAAALATDGDINTYCKTTPHVKSWVQIDLGYNCDVVGFEIYNVTAANVPPVGRVIVVFSEAPINPALWPQAPAPFSLVADLSNPRTLYSTVIFPDTAHHNRMYNPHTCRYVTIFPDTAKNASFILPEIKVFGSRTVHVNGQPYRADEITRIVYYDSTRHARGILEKINDRYWKHTVGQNPVLFSEYYEIGNAGGDILNLYSYDMPPVGCIINLQNNTVSVIEVDMGGGGQTDVYHIAEPPR